ncbi:sensor histidine kinase [Rummeliibacillus suwonensis]|uniref:sensor histidine kinase n=1 Tax=Rummeliibacillus suwonensis TaxID=1306154 RepID=UPI00289E9718|nr:HAMP domain-containing sensor histidine kinase [Rummeliibacillus suwonensis]
MGKFKNILILSSICIILIGAMTLFEYRHQFMNNFFESDRSDYSNYTSRLGALVLNPMDTDKVKRNIQVKNKEIEDYRHYNGSLSEQISDINVHYKEKIAEAKDAKATSVVKALTAERDKEIKKITKTFEDDKYVRAQIKKLKIEEIDRYAKNLEEGKQEFLNNFDYVAYELTDLSTGQTYTHGNMQDPALYTQKYDGKQQVLELPGIDDESSWTTSNDMTTESRGISYDLTDIVPSVSHSYKGEIRVSKTAFQNSPQYQEYQSFYIHKILLIALWILSVIAVLALVRNRPLKINVNNDHFLFHTIHKWPIDIRLAIIGVSGMGMIMDLFILSDFLANSSFNMFVEYFKIMVAILILYLFVWFITVQLQLLMEDMNTEEKRLSAYKKTLCFRILEGIRYLFWSMSLILQAMALLIVIFLAGVGIAIAAPYANELIVIYFFLFITVAIPTIIIFLHRISYINEIMKQTEEMAEGRLNSEIKVRGRSVFAKHAANLNRLREGVRISLSEQAKSERLKTELITNVSHDLRTPLTSIITYTDLLKNPDLTEDERNSYIMILDKKSQRLKTLIEDLFEVSKMASGNIELQKQKVDLNQLLQQALGEHEEDMEKADMTFRVHITDEIVMAYVDGQKWWRVLDNLIINALKYTMEGTRVYISLEKVGQDAQFVIKNITKYELGDQNVEELYERFKRADASRHTEGSGLGLAIAQSIVDLHGGRMEITVDGDLFKVTVTVPIVS